MANNIIINADDFNNAVDVINEISTTLFETKKGLEGISSDITINKEELENKLEILDKYFIKLDTIQKQVIGDKSLDKKFESYLKKIDDIYNLKITSLNEELEATRDDIKTSSTLIKKELLTETEEIKKSIFADVDTKLKIVDKLSVSQNITNFSKHASEFKNSANNLLSAVNTTNETLKEVQNLRKKGVAYFVSGVAFGAIVVSIFWWSKDFLGI